MKAEPTFRSWDLFFLFFFMHLWLAVSLQRRLLLSVIAVAMKRCAQSVTVFDMLVKAIILSFSVNFFLG